MSGEPEHIRTYTDDFSRDSLGEKWALSSAAYGDGRIALTPAAPISFAFDRDYTLNSLTMIGRRFTVDPPISLPAGCRLEFASDAESFTVYLGGEPRRIYRLHGDTYRWVT